MAQRTNGDAIKEFLATIDCHEMNQRALQTGMEGAERPDIGEQVKAFLSQEDSFAWWMFFTVKLMQQFPDLREMVEHMVAFGARTPSLPLGGTHGTKH